MSLNLYSNPSVVYKKAKDIFGDDVKIKPSTRKDKKYMLQNPNDKKFIHFGQLGYQDFTKHNDLQRKNLFKKRNKKWNKQDKYSAGFLSYNLLW